MTWIWDWTGLVSLHPPCIFFISWCNARAYSLMRRDQPFKENIRQVLSSSFICFLESRLKDSQEATCFQKGEQEFCLLHQMPQSVRSCTCRILNGGLLSRCLEGAGFYTIQLKPVDNWSSVSAQTSRQTNSRLITPCFQPHDQPTPALLCHSARIQDFKISPLSASAGRNNSATGGPLWTHSCRNICLVGGFNPSEKY